MTLLSSWMAPVDFTFSTGRSARLYRIDPINFLSDEDGTIPSPVAGILVAAADPASASPETINQKLSPEQVAEFWKILNRLVVASFAEPQIGGGEGQLPIFLVTPQEKMEVFRFQVGLEAASMSRFPPNSTIQGVYAVEDGGEVPSEAITDPGGQE